MCPDTMEVKERMYCSGNLPALGSTRIHIGSIIHLEVGSDSCEVRHKTASVFNPDFLYTNIRPSLITVTNYSSVPFGREI